MVMRYGGEEEDGNLTLMTALLTLSTALCLCGGTFGYTAISILLNYMTPPHAVGFANGIVHSIESGIEFPVILASADCGRCNGPIHLLTPIHHIHKILWWVLFVERRAANAIPEAAQLVPKKVPPTRKKKGNKHIVSSCKSASIAKVMLTEEGYPRAPLNSKGKFSETNWGSDTEAFTVNTKRKLRQWLLPLLLFESFSNQCTVPAAAIYFKHPQTLPSQTRIMIYNTSKIFHFSVHAATRFFWGF
ncbi:hypothetical protein BT96DRAFT_945679 [Gymnopus androsaceus JB14]|uniref:Uncharacterized protein n=1 Tax=Gymnopus androsaceus JB14 TaxID=1447944 RepID=A0A6A4H064_9AGAR|nr:hypothetical protein BT96DRAFT_945679 [Gymnopus androsaceus JB14]